MREVAGNSHDNERRDTGGDGHRTMRRVSASDVTLRRCPYTPDDTALTTVTRS